MQSRFDQKSITKYDSNAKAAKLVLRVLEFSFVKPFRVLLSNMLTIILNPKDETPSCVIVRVMDKNQHESYFSEGKHFSSEGPVDPRNIF